jgi:tyrosyl-tRNA synthetase
MSSSKPETMIRVDEKGNPAQQMYGYIIFPKLGSVDVKRPEKFGGDVTFTSYSELEATYLGKTWI